MEEKEMPDLENGIDPLVRRSHHIQTVVVVYRAIPGANYAALKLNGLINNQQNIYMLRKITLFSSNCRGGNMMNCPFVSKGRIECCPAVRNVTCK